ncbi:uncharacterized protein SPSC_06135 [Sporisorium scitamineum]|uniref:Apple domain-containing protein n=1 Tax=Sporisorium scitamineum TaxID=49012 RepID=A0A0F7RVD4_9BASI|nr:hypothetical protein [Sporisorium scitamineum]CDU25964.1 uncharacterized protein SPSC_06135 [Sporisorium scitamineum]
MTAYTQKTTSPHVVVAYKDDDEQDDQHSSLLPSSSSSAAPQPPAQSRRLTCWKRLILCVSLLAVCVGIFETAFHGREAESLQAAKAKIAQLEQQLSNKFRGGYDRVMASISPPPSADQVKSNATVGSEEAKGERDAIEAVKNKSVIVLKTGASVLFDRLPVQLLLAQSDIHPSIHLTGTPAYSGPSFFIYSDAPAQLGAFTVRDAFVNVSTYALNSPEFGPRYTSLHNLLSSMENSRASSFTEGWNLDKWKFLYMWQDAYRLSPNAEWYIGYEADTYVVWDSLFRFLVEQDSGKEQLFGCGYVLMTNQETFANGGCPYVISGALMRSTFGKDQHFAEKFDKVVEKSCCGDAELSIALRKSATVPLNGLADAGARFQREPPREVLFDEGNWCQPIFSFHHLGPDQVTQLSRIHRDILLSKPANQTILYSDFFDHIAPPHLQTALRSLEPDFNRSTQPVELNPTSENWEAFSSSDRGVQLGRKTNDAAQCKHQCMDSQSCTAWVWSKVGIQDAVGNCYLMNDVLRIGKAYEGTGMRTSGWVAKHIHSFKTQHLCKDPPAA